MHHVFVNCRIFKNWRAEAQMSVIEWTKEKLDAVEVEEVVKDNLLNAAKSSLLMIHWFGCYRRPFSI